MKREGELASAMSKAEVTITGRWGRRPDVILVAGSGLDYITELIRREA